MLRFDDVAVANAALRVLGDAALWRRALALLDSVTPDTARRTKEEKRKRNHFIKYITLYILHLNVFYDIFVFMLSISVKKST